MRGLVISSHHMKLNGRIYILSGDTSAYELGRHNNSASLYERVTSISGIELDPKLETRWNENETQESMLSLIRVSPYIVRIWGYGKRPDIMPFSQSTGTSPMARPNDTASQLCSD